MTNNINAIDVLVNRDRDLDFGLVDFGSFASMDDVKKLVSNETSVELDEFNIDELQTFKITAIDGDDYDCVAFQGNHVYGELTDEGMISMFQCLIKDTNSGNCLLVFSVSGWLEIDGAIDMATGTIGYYDSGKNVYTPVNQLSDVAIDELQEALDNLDLSIDCTCAVTKKYLKNTCIIYRSSIY